MKGNVAAQLLYYKFMFTDYFSGPGNALSGVCECLSAWIIGVECLDADVKYIVSELLSDLPLV